ncbi:hypothetical protein BDW66DRAFT_168156 [Aspergillus desertorum]
MKVLFFSNKFPVEEHADLFQRIRQQSRSSRHAVLRQLLDECTAAVREEIRLLPAEIRTRLPPFQSILDLAEGFRWERSPLAGTFECVFLCLAELCLFVGDYEARPQAFKFTRSDSVFTGLGLGFLAATAIVASPTLIDVPATAADVIRIAMRAGLVVYHQGQNLEPQSLSAPLQSWTTLVKRLGEEAVQRELDCFNSAIPRPSQIYISVVEPDGSVFINGPPSIMRLLFSTPGPLQSAPRAPLPVYGGPCHAAHLYDRSHVSWIVKHVRSEIAWREFSDAAPLLSMADGQPLRAQTALELFESAAYVLLTGIIRWGNVLAALEEREDGAIQIESCGHSTPVEKLMRVLHAPTRDLTEWLSDEIEAVPGTHADCRIAVVGMSCRLPGADDLEHFWELLEQGRDVHQHVPPDRYDVQSHTDPTGRRMNTSQTPFGCFIDSPGLFDAGFFDMSPREAGQTDPTHRLALLTAYEALQQSGYIPDRTLSTIRETVATIYGQCSDDYREANAGQEIDMYFIPGNYRAFAPGRISYFFKFSGPSFSCDTACSASLAAVQIACATLSRGEANMVVAGGLNILTSSDSFAGLSRAHFLSKTGGCKVFDDGADGYCRADGVGSLVLKRLADAQRDNDNILGVILAAATNHSSAAVSITHPHAPTQEELYRNVLRQAGVSPLDVDLVEMHGTGTQAGDAAEIESVTRVFSPSRRSERLYIGSVKANLGHGEAAAGVTALIKALLIFQHNAIPKHVGIKTALNSRFPDLGQLNVHIPGETVPWSPRPNRKRYVMVNNFSAAGGNTALLLEEPPQRPTPGPACAQTRFVVTVSAKNPLSLRRNLERLMAFLRQHQPPVHLGSLAYTTTARRIHYPHRIAVQGASIADIIKHLELRLADLSLAHPQGAVARPPPIAFVFSGQGSFYPGISHDLLEHYPPYAREIHQLDALCLRHGFPSILPALTSSENSPSPLVTQLTTVCVQIALTHLWKSLAITPAVVIGASLGEYAALHATGALSASDTIFLVGQRGLLMQDLCTANTHTMLAVQATANEIAGCVPDSLSYEVACINSHRSITIAGTRSNITAIKASLESRGYRATELNVPYAFHSSHMDPILEKFNAIAQQATARALKVPLISPLLVDVLHEHTTLPASYLAEATRGRVRFSEALEKAHQATLITDQTVFVEIGIHPTYSNAVRSTVHNIAAVVLSLRSDQDNWHTLAGSMAALYEAAAGLDWNAWFEPFEAELRLLGLPRYAWNLKNHWIQHNGDWLLWKDKDRDRDNGKCMTHPDDGRGLYTPLLHRIVEETFWAGGGRVVMESNVHQEEFFAVASGHKMCGRPVVSVFSYPDMALSLARFVYTKVHPDISPPAMDFGNVHIFEGLIPHKDRSSPQWVRLQIKTTSVKHQLQVSFHRVGEDRVDQLATGTVSVANAASWLSEWSGIAHLVSSRIKALHDLAHEGRADRLTRDTVYHLFRNSIVDYSPAYRGIQSAVIDGLEAVADVVLASSNMDRWTAPPHHVDSIAHVCGFVLNAGNAADHDNINTVYVMEGWRSMRFAKPLVSGRLYRSYVRMVPARDTGFFSGDVYVLDVAEDEVTGLLAGVTLRPLPRILMHRFFDPADDAHNWGNSPAKPEAKPEMAPTSGSSSAAGSPSGSSAGPLSTPEPLADPSEASLQSKASKASKALALIASETGIDMQDLNDETCLAQIGVDSLLSLVLVEKFALELGVHFPGSFFLDFPTVGEVKRQML